MQRLTRTTSVLIGLATLAALTLSGCGSDATPAAQKPVTASESSAGDAGDVSATDGDPAEAPASEPTGRLTLDGETWDLTYDADDPNASCRVVANTLVIVSGMRTPNGNRVNIHAVVASPSGASATYFDDNENPVRAVRADVSSEAPKWSLDGSTVRISGLWALLNDLTQPQVEGEVEVTC